jgi:coenzyme PQQ synthesis protein D (PqqD)
MEMQGTEPSVHFCRAPHIGQAEQAGAIMLFDGEQYYTLANDTANELWAFLADPRSAEELVERIHDRFDAPRDVIAKDIAAQLELLRRQGLVLAVSQHGERVTRRRPWWQVWRMR